MDTLKNVQEVHHCLSDIDSEAHLWMYNLTTNPIWQQTRRRHSYSTVSLCLSCENAL